jgi:hypothetical protein
VPVLLNLGRADDSSVFMFGSALVRPSGNGRKKNRHGGRRYGRRG